MEQQPPAIGIDLGTTYSVAARLDDAGRPLTLPNSEGDKLTPSVVLFDGQDVIVGKEALKAVATEMDHVADCPKRELGRRLFPKVIGGRQYPPEALEAWILNKIRKDLEARMGRIQQVVVTVPAYFDEVRRKATQDAGYMAGLEVLDIINEPTAAAVAFGYQEGFLDRQGASPDSRNVLVYDLGGGTFDVTLMEICGTRFATLATDGDVRLGGRDWDQRLVDYLAEEFIRKYGLDPREDPNTYGRLWRDCEDAKCTLSARSKTTVTCDYRGQAIRVEISREQLHEMTQDLLDRTAFTTRQTLQAAGLDWGQIDRVLLVGGSTRMPAVRDMLQQMSGKAPDTSVSPDEAVAHGAALHAGWLLARHHGHAPRFSIRNVNSHSLGVVANDPQTRRKRNAVLIPRNTPLPVTARRIFRTQKSGQRSIRVEIVEGESASPDDCSQVGRCSVRHLPPNLPADTSIEVAFRYHENGRLEVTVAVQGTNTLLRHEITRENSLSQQQLDSWRRYISGSPPTA